LFPESSRLFPESSRLFPESSRLFPESSRLFPESTAPICDAWEHQTRSVREDVPEGSQESRRPMARRCARASARSAGEAIRGEAAFPQKSTRTTWQEAHYSNSQPLFGRQSSVTRVSSELLYAHIFCKRYAQRFWKRIRLNSWRRSNFYTKERSHDSVIGHSGNESVSSGRFDILFYDF
jgi:hypothetical protein